MGTAAVRPEHLAVIARSPLFGGIATEEAQAMLQCLEARTRDYPKGSYLARIGDEASLVGMVLSGEVRTEREDYWGARTIISSAGPGQLFGEVHACEPGLPFDMNLVAAHDSTVLLMDVRRVTTSCTSACAFHTRLIRNLLAAMARQTHELTRTIDHLSRRTTREKLLSYLSEQAEHAHSDTFSIPYNRQELADHLSVDRSAMSTELSKMKREGIVDFDRNRFRLKDASRDPR